MEAVRTFETSVHFNVTTRRYIPEDSKLHTRRRENLKCHVCISFSYVIAEKIVVVSYNPFLLHFEFYFSDNNIADCRLDREILQI
jgi:hypothetical protein